MFKLKKFMPFFIMVLVVSFMAAGCGKGSGDSNKDSSEGGTDYGDVIINEEGKIYQYQQIDMGNVFIKLDGKKVALSELPEDKRLILSKKSYANKWLALGVGSKKYKVTLKDYVSCEDLSWSYDGNPYVPDGTETKEDLKASKLKGILTYEDGTKYQVSVVDYYVINNKGAVYVVVTDGVNVFRWETSEESSYEGSEGSTEDEKVEGILNKSVEEPLSLDGRYEKEIAELESGDSGDSEDNEDEIILNGDDIDEGFTVGPDDATPKDEGSEPTPKAEKEKK